MTTSERIEVKAKMYGAGLKGFESLNGVGRRFWRKLWRACA